MDTITVEISGVLIAEVLTKGYSITRKTEVMKGIPPEYRLDAIVYNKETDIARLHFNHKDAPYGEYTFSGEVTDIEVREVEY